MPNLYFSMKWGEILGVIVGIGALIQILNWIFGFVGLIDDSLRFLISSVYALLIIILFIQYQSLSDMKKMKDFLNTKGFKDNRRKMFSNKKGVIDPRILWIVIALVILYLLWKSIFG